jgi:hypothetical protein
VTPEQQVANWNEDLAIDVFAARRQASLAASVDGRSSRLQGPAPEVRARAESIPPRVRVARRRRRSRRLPSIDVESVVIGLAIVLLIAAVGFVAVSYSVP